MPMHTHAENQCTMVDASGSPATKNTGKMPKNGRYWVNATIRRDQTRKRRRRAHLYPYIHMWACALTYLCVDDEHRDHECVEVANNDAQYKNSDPGSQDPGRIFEIFYLEGLARYIRGCSLMSSYTQVVQYQPRPTPPLKSRRINIISKYFDAESPCFGHRHYDHLEN